MKLTVLTITGCLAATMALPVISLADGKNAAEERQTTTPATAMLLDLRSVAAEASDHAAELESAQANRYVDLSAHTEALEALKSDINKMGDQFARLEKVRDSASAVEQKAIADAAPLLESMAWNTRAAIAFVNENPKGMWELTYRTYVKNISTTAGRLSATMGAFVQYTKTFEKEQRLEKTLNLVAGSI